MALLKKINLAETAESTELSIPNNTVFTGNIKTQSNARINGVIQGDILSENGNILFGSGSNISGNVSGNDIAIGGSVRGDVESHGQISIFAGASVSGNIIANALLIEKDAAFEGHVKVSQNKKHTPLPDGEKPDKGRESIYSIGGDRKDNRDNRR